MRWTRCATRRVPALSSRQPGVLDRHGRGGNGRPGPAGGAARDDGAQHAARDGGARGAVHHAGLLWMRALTAWLCDRFAVAEKEQAQRTGRSVYDIVLEGDPADRGVLFLPHLSGTGTPWQDADSRGAFVGLTTASDVRSLAHAVIAGVTYELRTTSMASGGGMGINALKVVGGGARSDTWLQLKADVLERRSTAWRLARQGAWVRRCLLATAVGCSTTSRPRRGGTRDGGGVPSVGARRGPPAPYAIYRQLYPALKPLHAQIARLDAV